MKVRIGEHIGAAKSNTDIYTIHTISGVSHHFRDIHAGDLTNMSVISTERVNKPHRGGDWSRRLLMRGAFSILKINTRFPFGLHLKTYLKYLY